MTNTFALMVIGFAMTNEVMAWNTGKIWLGLT
jgi:hypothetical protein